MRPSTWMAPPIETDCTDIRSNAMYKLRPTPPSSTVHCNVLLVVVGYSWVYEKFSTDLPCFFLSIFFFLPTATNPEICLAVFLHTFTPLQIPACSKKPTATRDIFSTDKAWNTVTTSPFSMSAPGSRTTSLLLNWTKRHQSEPQTQLQSKKELIKHKQFSTVKSSCLFLCLALAGFFLISKVYCWEFFARILGREIRWEVSGWKTIECLPQQQKPNIKINMFWPQMMKERRERVEQEKREREGGESGNRTCGGSA